MSLYVVPLGTIAATSLCRLLDGDGEEVATSSYPDGRDLAQEWTAPSVRYAPQGSYTLEVVADGATVDRLVVVGVEPVVGPPTSPFAVRLAAVEAAQASAFGRAAAFALAYGG